MGVKITGMSKVMKEIEKKIGEKRLTEISDRALQAGAKVFLRELNPELESFKDTGGTIEEVAQAEPMFNKDGTRIIKVHWKGPKGRYRIIHLNEWGTVKNPNPKGKGAIARALLHSTNDYKKAIKKELQDGI